MKIGDKVYIDGYTSMAQQNYRESSIKKVETRFDELSGNKFEICQVDGDWYDSRDGSCYSNKDSMYFIEFDEINNYVRSDKFKEDFHEQVKKDTWGNGIPMIYKDENNNIVSHWEDGVKDILQIGHELINKVFYLDLGSTPVRVMVVFVSTENVVTVRELLTDENKFMRFTMDDFKNFVTDFYENQEN